MFTCRLARELLKQPTVSQPPPMPTIWCTHFVARAATGACSIIETFERGTTPRTRPSTLTLRSGSTAHDHCRHPSLQSRPSLLLVTVRPRQRTRALSTQLAVSQPIFTVVCGPRWSIRPDRLSQLDPPSPSRPSTSINDGVRGARISIAPTARLPSPSRDFLPWPFAYAGRRYMPRRRHGRHPQTFTIADVST